MSDEIKTSKPDNGGPSGNVHQGHRNLCGLGTAYISGNRDGFESGYLEGLAAGYKKGMEAGYKAGKKDGPPAGGG